MAYSVIDTSDTGGMLCTLGLSSASLSSATASCTPAEFNARSIAYTISGALLSGGSDGSDGRVRLWRSALPQAAGPDVGMPSSWALSPDGRTMAAWISSASDKPPLTGIWDSAAPGGPVLDAPLPVSAEKTEYVSPTVLLTVTGDGAVRLWDLRDPRHPVRGAGLGIAAVSLEGESVQAEGSLVVVQDPGGRLRLWHVTGADAVSAAGSVPASGTTPGFAGITANARAAVMLTKAGITWWDIADPARPLRVGVTPPKDMDPGVGLGVGGVFAAESGGAPGTQGIGTDLYLFDVSGGRPGTGVSPATSTGGQLAISADAACSPRRARATTP